MQSAKDIKELALSKGVEYHLRKIEDKLAINAYEGITTLHYKFDFYTDPTVEEKIVKVLESNGFEISDTKEKSEIKIKV